MPQAATFAQPNLIAFFGGEMSRSTNNGSQMHLNAFLLASGHHESAWRLPGANPLGATDVAHWTYLAEVAERGKLDSVFLADQVYIGWKIEHMPSPTALEPVMVLAAMAMCTKHVGLIGTQSTSFNEPYNLARTYATLDHMSGGRAAWNCITSTTDDEARNFGFDALTRHAERYERATEFIEVVQKLWDSWEESALVADPERGLWGDVELIHRVDHEGKHFRVAGPLTTPRSPQGRPVIFEAGSSEAGMRLAAHSADAVFTAQTTMGQAQDFYERQRRMVEEAGRRVDEVVILPGFMPIIGSTEDEARALETRLIESTSDAQLLGYLSQTFEHKFRAEELDRLFGEISLPETEGHRGRPSLLREMALREGLTLRQLARRTLFARGHSICVGTPDQVADEMERWFHSGACDGFNIMAPVLPLGLELFVDQVVPILQERGLFRRDYEGSTLRENLGLLRPPSQYEGAVQGE